MLQKNSYKQWMSEEFFSKVTPKFAKVTESNQKSKLHLPLKFTHVSHLICVINRQSPNPPLCFDVWPTLELI